jgi:serine phosphatase RsbU (regulator of sigma subunit)
MQLLKIYLVVVIFGITVITLHNLYINNLPLTHFFQTYFWIKCLMGCLLIVLFHLYSRWRLSAVYRYLRQTDAHGDKHGHGRQAAWTRLLRFPAEIFWAMIVYGLTISPAYHLSLFFLQEDRMSRWSMPQGLYILENLLFDQALTLMLATLFYAILRRFSRTYLAKIGHYEIRDMQPSSFVAPLVMTFVSLLLISLFSMLWFVTNSVSSDREIQLTSLFAIALTVFAVGVVLFVMQAVEHRNSFREMIHNIRSLMSQDREHLAGKVPITSLDEAGQLAAVFNQLQNRISGEYEEVERELRLARSVQQKLLPKEYQEIGALQIAGTYRPTKDVGGDFYDVLDLRDGRAAIIVGDVAGKGLQAALIMSAVVVLWRTEMRRGGSAADILTRLNNSLAETIQNDSYVTMGLAIFDAENGSFEYASAGHVSPYLLRDGRLQPLECSSLPLGIESGIVYHSIRMRAKRGDCVVFYTDGIVEAMDERMELFGFQRFERLLSQLEPRSDPLQAIRSLMDRIPQGGRGAHEDDKTIVMAVVVR